MIGLPSTALFALIGQSVAPDSHAHLRMLECFKTGFQCLKNIRFQEFAVAKREREREREREKEREKEKPIKTKKGQAGSF